MMDDLRFQQVQHGRSKSHHLINRGTYWKSSKYWPSNSTQILMILNHKALITITAKKVFVSQVKLRPRVLVALSGIKTLHLVKITSGKAKISSFLHKGLCVDPH